MDVTVIVAVTAVAVLVGVVFVVVVQGLLSACAFACLPSGLLHAIFSAFAFLCVAAFASLFFSVFAFALLPCLLRVLSSVFVCSVCALCFCPSASQERKVPLPLPPGLVILHVLSVLPVLPVRPLPPCPVTVVVAAVRVCGG